MNSTGGRPIKVNLAAAADDAVGTVHPSRLLQFVHGKCLAAFRARPQDLPGAVSGIRTSLLVSSKGPQANYASLPWQCLYFLPEPQEHNSFRLNS
jgi:hypothetical protein